MNGAQLHLRMCGVEVEVARGCGALLPLAHLSDGHVVLHVSVILQKNKARQDVSKGSRMRTDSFKITIKRGDFLLVAAAAVTSSVHSRLKSI